MRKLYFIGYPRLRTSGGNELWITGGIGALGFALLLSSLTRAQQHAPAIETCQSKAGFRLDPF
jgi:hypothetical protein